jgi:hypothetical protein
MPHYKDGKKARVFDRVKFPSGTVYALDAAPATIFAEGLVVGVHEGASSCELDIAVTKGGLLGGVNLPQFPGDEHPPRQGVILDGYWTTANAKDCELVPRAPEPDSEGEGTPLMIPEVR